MFLRRLTIKRNVKKYDYWQLVATYRERKTQKVRQKTILHLSRLTAHEATLAKSSLTFKKPGAFITTWQDIRLKQSVEFLTVGILTRIWHHWELDKFLLSTRPSREGQLGQGREPVCRSTGRLVSIATVSQILVINRTVSPQSDFKVQSWYKKTILPVLLKTPTRYINLPQIYRTLDALLTVEPALQRYLYEMIKEKGLSEFDLIFYDITSIYFEGIGPSLAARGHPHGHSDNKRQILLALAITKDGFLLIIFAR